MPCITLPRAALSITALLITTATFAGTTSPDEKFIPPNLSESGRVGCYIEGNDPEHADAKVFTQYATGRVDYSAVIARRSDVKQLALDCAKWFHDIAEAFPKTKEK